MIDNDKIVRLVALVGNAPNAGALSDRLGHILELGRAQIADSQIEPRLHLPIGVLGETDRAGLSDPFQSRGDIDAIAHQIAITSSTTSPRWMPTRNSMRRSGGRPALRSTMPFCTSMAQRTASTTLLNSIKTPSPVRLTGDSTINRSGLVRGLADARRGSPASV